MEKRITHLEKSRLSLQEHFDGLKTSNSSLQEHSNGLEQKYSSLQERCNELEQSRSDMQEELRLTRPSRLSYDFIQRRGLMDAHRRLRWFIAKRPALKADGSEKVTAAKDATGFMSLQSDYVFGTTT